MGLLRVCLVIMLSAFKCYLGLVVDLFGVFGVHLGLGYFGVLLRFYSLSRF